MYNSHTNATHDPTTPTNCYGFIVSESIQLRLLFTAHTGSSRKLRYFVNMVRKLNFVICRHRCYERVLKTTCCAQLLASFRSLSHRSFSLGGSIGVFWCNNSSSGLMKMTLSTQTWVQANKSPMCTSLSCAPVTQLMFHVGCNDTVNIVLQNRSRKYCYYYLWVPSL